jgi:nucleotide-binding universal stress UspA family protein
MKETNSIVVPVDFSEITDKLVEYATDMAGKLSAVIHFIHVVHFYPAGNTRLGHSFVQECEERLLVSAKERMSDILKDNRGRCSGCTGEVTVGDPVDTITEFARAKDSDLIIISTHGAKGFEKILLGSVTERVLKRAHCPVLVMNPYKK